MYAHSIRSFLFVHLENIMEGQIKWPFFGLAFRQPKDFPSRQKRDKCLTEYAYGKERKGEFESFLKRYEEKSEFCQYLSVFQDIFKDQHRDGNRHLHVDAVRLSLPLFWGSSAITYLRYPSIYLEKIQTLQHTHLSLYERFVQDFLLWEIHIQNWTKHEQLFKGTRLICLCRFFRW